MARVVIVEFNEDASDNRPLGTSGSFLVGRYAESEVAIFPSIDSGLHRGALAPNRRAGCTLEAIGQSRKVSA